MGTGFLPGPPSRIRCLIPSSAKNPLASATMIGANSPLRSHPSCVLTSTGWPHVGGTPARDTASARERRRRHERRSGIGRVSLIAREAGELAEERRAARAGAVTAVVGRGRGGDRLDDD